MTVEGTPSVEGPTEEVARACQRENHHGERLDRGFWRILEMSEIVRNRGE